MFKFKILIESEIKREGLLKSAFYNENFIVVPENVVFFIKFFDAIAARILGESLSMFSLGLCTGWQANAKRGKRRKAEES